MAGLPNIPFAELAVHLEGASAGARIATGYAAAEPWAKGAGCQSEIAAWQRDAKATQQLADLFAELAPFEELVRDFIAGVLGADEQERRKTG